MQTDPIIATFVAWIKVKIKTQLSERVQFFNEGEVWWVSLGQNIGYEANGKNDKFERPVMIIKKFNKDIFWGLSISSQKKTGPYYYSTTIKKVFYCFNLSQLRVLSSKRLIRHMTELPKDELTIVRSLLGKILL